MGLDITKYRVTCTDENDYQLEYIIYEGCEKSIEFAMVADKFPHLVKKGTTKVIDLKATAAKYDGMLPECSGYMFDEVGVNYTFKNSDGTYTHVHSDDTVDIEVPYYYINLIEVGYQRKGLEPGLVGIFSNHNNGSHLVDSQEVLDMVKEITYDGYPLHEWELKEDEVVIFDW